MNTNTLALALKAIILSAFLSSVACADEAISPIAPLDNSFKNEGLSSDEHTDLDLTALTFEGRDPFGTKCSLHISGFEDAHLESENDEHGFEFVAKLSYGLHGQSAQDSIVDFKRYDLDTNTYYPLDSSSANSMPVMVSAILSDEDETVDYNKLVEYENNGILLQSLRADFFDVDTESFTEALETVLEDNSTFEANKSVLDQLQGTVLKIQHNGHYDAASCSRFKLTSIEEIEFELGKGHDDDHDDDHGDHDDDHGDDDDHDDDHDGHDH